jgi:phospholipid/cholesterol/gamma-HCH transport system substrate-binding protein
MKSISRKELLIGACALIALVVLVFGIDYLKGINVFKASNYYYVSYENVEGLAVSAPVNVNGFKVGQVRDISYEYDNPGHVLVELELDKQLKVPEGSKALLIVDMLGTGTITLDLTDNAKCYEVGSKIPGDVPKGLMANVSDNLMPAVSAIFPKVDTLLTNINNLLADPALAASVKRLDAITNNLELTTVQLNRTVAALPAVATDVKSITGNFVTTSDNFAQLSTKLNNAPIDSIMTQLQTTAANLRVLTDELKNPNSTLGLLMNDPKLYNNLNNTVNSLDSLFIDIKEHPKRYINIKLL